jgi:hypothetical protein
MVPAIGSRINAKIFTALAAEFAPAPAYAGL